MPVAAPLDATMLLLKARVRALEPILLLAQNVLPALLALGRKVDRNPA